MSTPPVLATWNRWSGSWAGRLLVSGAVWLRAPYFLTAAPVIRSLERGAEATVPSTHRWIPAGMTVTYQAKATTDLRAVATFAHPPAFDDTRENVDAEVAITDARGTEVVHATIRVSISPRPPR